MVFVRGGTWTPRVSRAAPIAMKLRFAIWSVSRVLVDLGCKVGMSKWDL